MIIFQKHKNLLKNIEHFSQQFENNINNIHAEELDKLSTFSKIITDGKIIYTNILGEITIINNDKMIFKNKDKLFEKNINNEYNFTKKYRNNNWWIL